MKTTLSFLFLFLFVVPVNMYCQVIETPAQKIRRLEDQERVAIIHGDTTMLFRLWSPDYVVNNPDNMILNAAELKAFMRMGGMDSTAFTKKIEKLVFVKDVAIVMGAETVAAKNKFDNAGKPITRRYTDIWIKTDTSWQLSARQATNMPVH